MEKWYLYKNNQTLGPFSSDEIRLMLTSNEIHLKTPIWSKELGEWVFISDVKNISDSIAHRPPAVPDQFKTEIIYPQEKSCPICFNLIPAKAIICKYCEHHFAGSHANQKSDTQNKSNINNEAEDTTKVKCHNCGRVNKINRNILPSEAHCNWCEKILRPTFIQNFKTGVYKIPLIILSVLIIILIVSSIRDYSFKSKYQEQELPRTGVISTSFSPSSAVAPFEIVTKHGSKDHYYIKIYYHGSERLAATLFIRAGGRVEFEIPLGAYEMRWASGIAEKWYGINQHFGPKTNYYRADEILRFSETYDGYTGWTVELYMQEGGNLERKKISASDF